MTAFPQTITIIRHGEKPTGQKHSPLGVDERGKEQADSLTPRGWQRAGALAVLLGGRAVPTPFLRPTILYTCGYPTDPQGLTRRPRETITPLSLRLGLTIQVPVIKDHGADLATDYVLKESGQDVLICWEHHHIPPMVAALAKALDIKEIPAAGRLWPEDDFSTALIFSRAGQGYDLRQVNQDVLSGD